jgi:phosphate transport system permease protein
MDKRRIIWRKLIDNLIKALSIFFVCITIMMMGWIIYTVIGKGAQAFNMAFFVEPTAPYGVPEGGIANAIIGTILITCGATVIGVPCGVLGGIYLAEFGSKSRIGDFIRFAANVMMGMPSIIVGLFVYALLVYTTKHFSGFAGSIALAIIMFPVILRTTEDMLSMVPNALRESALALGMPHWKSTFYIIFRSAKDGLITGVLLAIARVSGETAPLLFTALWSDDWPTDFFSQPTANMTVTINEYATNSPFDIMHTRAWGAALLITAIILILNISCRIVFGKKSYN